MDTWHTHKQTHTPLTIKIIGTDDDDDVGTRGLMTQRASFEIWTNDRGYSFVSRFLLSLT